MSHAIVTEKIVLAGDEPGYYKVKIPGVEEPVEMWCVSADELTIGSKVAIADLDNDHVWSKNNILPNSGVYTYSDSRLWVPPEAMDQARASLARAYIYFDNWQQSCPTYRRDKITEIIDTEYVRLRDYGAGRPVKVDYMECDAEAFEVDDYVVVAFESADWNKPVVVGFHEYPRDCLVKFYIRPQIDGRDIYYGGQQFKAVYQKTSDPGVWYETPLKPVRSDSQWDGSTDGRWGVCGPFELDLWDKVNVKIALDIDRDWTNIRGDIPWTAQLGFYLDDEEYICCFGDKYPPTDEGCPTVSPASYDLWLGCIAGSIAACANVQCFRTWLNIEGLQNQFWGLNQMFDLWAVDNTNGTHRSFYYSRRMLYDDTTECSPDECPDSRCPLIAGPGTPWPGPFQAFKAYRNLREWGRMNDITPPPNTTPSADWYRQLQYLAITITADEILTAPTESVYNDLIGDYEEAKVLTRNFAFNLKQTSANYLAYHPCRSDGVFRDNCSYFGTLWYAFYDTMPVKRQRRKARGNFSADQGDVSLLNLVWYDYPMPHLPLRYPFKSGDPYFSCWFRAQKLGCVVYVDENARSFSTSCNGPYCQNSPDPGAANFNCMIVVTDEETFNPSGPTASYAITRPYYQQKLKLWECPGVGSYSHAIGIETEPIHKYWL